MTVLTFKKLDNLRSLLDSNHHGLFGVGEQAESPTKDLIRSGVGVTL